MFEQENLVRLTELQMPFGKYQGRLIIDLPEEYLLWFAKKEFPKGELGLLMRLALEIKIEGLTSLLDPLRKQTNNR